MKEMTTTLHIQPESSRCHVIADGITQSDTSTPARSPLEYDGCQNKQQPSHLRPNKAKFYRM